MIIDVSLSKLFSIEQHMKESAKHKILFVCLGNICRSPAAHGLMEHFVEQQGLQHLIEVDSAGTFGGHAGDLPDPRMRRAAAGRGYQLPHSPRRIREEDYYNFDTKIVMDDMNYEDVSRLAPERKFLDKLHRLVEFCTQHPDRSSAPDPYYEGREGCELVLDMLEDGCQGIIRALNDE